MGDIGEKDSWEMEVFGSRETKRRKVGENLP